MKVRADQLLVARGLAPTRARAQALVLAGKVYVGEARIDKAGALLPEDAAIVRPRRGSSRTSRAAA